MDNRQLSVAMRNSFQRLSSISILKYDQQLSDDDIKAMALFGITSSSYEPYRPVSIEDAKSMLEEVSASYSKSKINGYLEDAQNRVMEAIIRPFGLAKVIFDDQNGGNVTTINNAKQGIYADKNEEYNSKDYRTYEYNKLSRDIKDNNTINPDVLSDLSWTPDNEIPKSKNDFLINKYSGEETSPSSSDTDHVYSTEAYHKDGGYMQSNEQRRAFGADPDNLALTHQSGNRSKGSKKIDEWQQAESSDGTGRSNKETHNHDNRRVNPTAAKGKATAERHLPTDTDKAMYYSKKMTKSGLKEGAKMGLQQAMGVFLLEVSRAMWSEIKDALSSGIYTEENQTFMKAIVARLKRVGAHVLSKWKDIVIAFKDGAISGFLSDLINTVIHMFLKSAKNISRLLREGFMSLAQGFKFVLFPPEGFTKEEAFHEAGKLVIGGVAVGLGIIAEEAVSKGIASIPVIGAVIAPFSGSIAPVLVGIAVGLGTSLLCYLWDRLDLFGAEENRRHKFILDILDKYQKQSTLSADLIVTERNKLSAANFDIVAAVEELDKEIIELLNA